MFWLIRSCRGSTWGHGLDCRPFNLRCSRGTLLVSKHPDLDLQEAQLCRVRTVIFLRNGATGYGVRRINAISLLDLGQMVNSSIAGSDQKLLDMKENGHLKMLSLLRILHQMYTLLQVHLRRTRPQATNSPSMHNGALPDLPPKLWTP